MISLYADQQALVDQTREKMMRNKSVLMVAPTGSGKTRMAMHIIDSARSKGKRMCFTVPRKNLLEQTSEAFKSFGIPHSFIAAGKPYNPFAKIFIGMIPTMAARVQTLPKLDLLIPDETHYGSNSLDVVIGFYKAMGAWILGLSATPWKLSGQGLGCWYDDISEGLSMRELIDLKRLSDYRYFYGRTRPDLSKISVTAGDYAKGQLADYMEHQGVIIGDCVDDYKRLCAGKLHLVRCASIKASEITAQAFRDAGVAATHVSGVTPPDERRRIFKSLAKRELTVVTFCDLLGFGFDLSQISGEDVCIESISDLRPSKSLAGQLQFWGRAFRAKEKPAIICDNVSNHIDSGFPDDERQWTLEDRVQGKKIEIERAALVRQCPNPRCRFVHRPAPACPNCGHVYLVQSREIDHMDGELVEATKETRAALKAQKSVQIKINKREQGQARTLGELVALGKKRGMAHPEKWALKIMQFRKRKGR
jgi:superfamily II DNA or RNA helicase